ncbi:MAG TPA: hypothetical protein IAC74_06265, partial [Candidatus Aphodoplasma excrementigallinarum]|nr:hypothetical protein [Candidatus Aphodoplasma excrementigallinarum]
MKRAKALLVLLLCVLIPSTGSDWAHAEEGGVTRLEFYELVMQTMEQKGTITHFGIGYEPFADVSNAYVSEAYALGLVKGDALGRNAIHTQLRARRWTDARIWKILNRYCK